MGIPITLRSAEAFLLLKDLLDEDKVRLALNMYDLHMTVQHCRHCTDPTAIDFGAMLRLFVFRAANGSRAMSLLRQFQPGHRQVGYFEGAEYGSYVPERL